MALGGASEMYAVDMQEADHLSSLQGAVTSFQPSMSKYHREHHAYKFQLAVDVILHKAVDPAVITVPRLHCHLKWLPFMRAIYLPWKI